MRDEFKIPKGDYKKAQRIDQIIDYKFDIDKLATYIKEQRDYMLEDRQKWMARQSEYLGSWDDFVTYHRKGLWEESSNLHLPLTLQILQAVHARFKEAIFSVMPWWVLLPVEKMDAERLKNIDTVMNWSVKSYVNHKKGIDTVIDDWLWDTIGVGWGVVKRRWALIQRKAIILEDVTPEEKEQNMDNLEMLAEMKAKEEMGETLTEEEGEVVAKEVEKIIKVFDGPIIERWPHEDFLMPGHFNDVSDLDEPHIIGFDYRLSKSDFLYQSHIGLLKKEWCEKVFQKAGVREPGQVSTSLYGQDDLKRRQDAFQGVETIDAKAGLSNLKMTEFMLRYDIDEDGYNEEVVVQWNEDTNQICGFNFLDRLTKTGKRPVHKADFIRRPGRAYSLGLIEVLYPLNKELDEMHNMRMDFGTLSNIPFFFFRAGSGMKPEKMRLEPGAGIPLDDPQNDINFPRLNNSTVWGFQEEQNLVSWAEKVTSITSMNSGIPSQRVGASRTSSGLNSLLNESNLNLNVKLGRFKNAYASLLKGHLGDLQQRMPNDLKVRVLGSDANLEFGMAGEPMFITPTREDIAGQVDFFICANSTNSNRELEQQKAMQHMQLLLNPYFLQSGIVQPQNAYEAIRNVLEKNGQMGIDKLLTAPPLIRAPLSLYDEIACITQGQVPEIVWNDNHQAKIEGLKLWSQNEGFLKGIEMGVNSKNAMQALNLAVGIHMMMLQTISAQAQGAQNMTGMAVAPATSAQGANPQARQQIAQGQAPTGTSEGGMNSNGGQGAGAPSQ